MKKKTKFRIFWGVVGGMVIISMVMFTVAIGFGL